MCGECLSFLKTFFPDCGMSTKRTGSYRDKLMLVAQVRIRLCLALVYIYIYMNMFCSAAGGA